MLALQIDAHLLTMSHRTSANRDLHHHTDRGPDGVLLPTDCFHAHQPRRENAACCASIGQST